MKLKRIFTVAIAAVVCISLTTNLAFGTEKLKIELSERIQLQSGEPLLSPQSFAVTEDSMLLIPDYRGGNLKIYERTGRSYKLAQVVGQQLGSESLSKPSFCFYNVSEGLFGVFDNAFKKIFIYQRHRATTFKRIEEIQLPDLAYDIGITGDGRTLLVSGYITDSKGNPFDLYTVDIDSGQKRFLLPSHEKYGLSNSQEYVEHYRNDTGIRAMGILGFFDLKPEKSDFSFLVWQANLDVIRINLNSGERTRFGNKTAHYKQPEPSDRLVAAYRSRNFATAREEKNKCSYITNIFASSNHIYILYETNRLTKDKTNLRIQIYTTEGKFINDIPVPGNPGRIMAFAPTQEMLYSLTKIDSEYYVLKYKISH